MGLSYADTPVMKVCDGLNDDEIPGAARLPRKKSFGMKFANKKKHEYSSSCFACCFVKLIKLWS